MDKLSNEISFSSDSPQQVGPVRGSGTSATSHLLLTNRINVRACHVRSGVAMQLNTKCQHKHPQGVLQGCFYTAFGAGRVRCGFFSVLRPWFGDTRRQDTLCQFGSALERTLIPVGDGSGTLDAGEEARRRQTVC